MTTYEKIATIIFIIQGIGLLWVLISAFTAPEIPFDEGTLVDCPECGRETNLAPVRNFGCCGNCLSHSDYP